MTVEFYREMLQRIVNLKVPVSSDSGDLWDAIDLAQEIARQALLKEGKDDTI